MYKQVGGYMRSGNLQIPCVQPQISSNSLQLPHGRHGHGGHGDRVSQGGHVGQDKTGQDGTGQDGTKLK